MSNNPYQSPGGGNLPPKENYGPHKISRSQLDFSEAFHFPMTNPNWLMNCLMIGLVNVIPIAGPIVTLGYLFDDYEQLLKEGRPAPTDFKFEKFMDYLQRGVMPFLAMLLVGLVIGMVSMVLIVPFIITGMVLLQNEQPIGMFMLFGGEFCGVMSSIILGMLAAPISLRVGLSGKFEEITNVKWAVAMLKAMWVQMVIGAIVTSLFWMIAAPIGILLCCVGIIPMSGFFNYFYFHIQRQWYEMFVTQGGEPIPLGAGQPFKL